MDTSPTYILMCQKATEIQALEQDEEHQWCACPHCGNILHEDDGWYFGHCEGDAVWLPRQDQLLEMVQPKDRRIHEWVSEFAEFTMAQPRTIPNAFDTMEMLLLKFVMKEKFGKSWSGEDWTCTTSPTPK